MSADLEIPAAADLPVAQCFVRSAHGPHQHEAIHVAGGSLGQHQCPGRPGTLADAERQVRAAAPSIWGGAWGAAMDAAVRARDEWRAAEAGPMAGHPDDPECFAIAEAVLAVVRSADPAKAVPAGMMPCSRMAARCSQCDAIEHVDTGGRLVEHDAEGRRCCGSGTDDFERSHGSTAGAGTPEVQA